MNIKSAPDTNMETNFIQKTRVFFYTIICMTLTITVSCEREKTLGESCMSLSASIAQSPGTDIGTTNYDTYADLKVPPLSPAQALESFELEEGFRIEVVAHEPMVVDPVAMDIDADGRLWVVDMPSYMPVHDMGDWETAVREQVPQGRVVVLEDTNGDGIMDTHRIFREGLILPRAIKVFSDGILVGEPPNVWFIRDTTGDGKGDTRELVTDDYGDPNVTNVESLPNGLMWGMDNWLHSSEEAGKSIRRVDGNWQFRPFNRLGQWGMTQDDWGRLYSANNTRPLQTHLVPYGYSERHPLFEVSTGKNLNISPNEPMWPAHAVGTNRSYRIEQEVRTDGTLKRATSTLGPVIYRGDQYGDEYRGNAFTPEPAANFIKRLIIEDDPAEIDAEARFAYEGREFLTSTDERFRPVNMYNSPDGTMYVVDMYRGIIQHARFMTEHLREHIEENELYKPFGMYGRIYRIVREDREINYDTPKFSELRPGEVADYLMHKNGLLRDQAQQILVQCSPESVVPQLESLVRNESVEAYTRLQALWTLEGYRSSVYNPDQLTNIAMQSLEDEHPRIRAAAVRILEAVIAQGDERVFARLEELVESETAEFVQLQLLASLGESSDERALHWMAAILNEHSDNPYFREMALTGVYERETQMAEVLRNEYGWSEEQGEDFEVFLASLADAENGATDKNLDALTEAQRDLYERGQVQYGSCMACHGSDGRGVSGIGPALSGSEWVQKEPEALVRLILQGFEGGVAENPRQAVNIAGVMPQHSFMSDEDIAAILTYIRLSWDNEASPIEPEEVTRIRRESEGRQDLWTPEELRALLN